MSKNQNTFIKKQKAELKKRKQKEKLEKKLARKEQPKSGELEDMLAYVDEFGNISETPPEPEPPKKQPISRNQYSNNKQQSKN
ncbi:cold-shock protein [Algoriphagus sp.]|uniref:cold-shock protein n=1 Tax=Algoriphagus sp. TaxID=1872435 RepID=UPI00261D1A80|nr:cold-shock protein [Algoriphagus sp.]